MSVYNTLVQERGYTTMIYPILYPHRGAERNFYDNRLAPTIAEKADREPEKHEGFSTEPQRFSEEDIAARRLSYGKAGFALQFMLNTALSDAEKFPLKVSDLIVTSLDHEQTSLTWVWAAGPQQQLELPCVALRGDRYCQEMQRSPEVAPYANAVMGIDPSGRSADETAYAIVKYLNGYLFLVESGGFKDGYTDRTLEALAQRAKFHNVHIVVCEPNFGGGMFSKLLTPVMLKHNPDGCAVEDAKWSVQQKEKRIIDTLEPVLMRHKLIVDRQVITNDFAQYEKDPATSLIYQMTRLSADKGALAHDDRVDALTLAIDYWKESMDRNEQAGLDDHFAEQLEKWLDPDYGVTYKEEKGWGGKDFQRFNLLDRYK
jgi:hypothetical protein